MTYNRSIRVGGLTKLRVHSQNIKEFAVKNDSFSVINIVNRIPY